MKTWTVFLERFSEKQLTRDNVVGREKWPLRFCDEIKTNIPLFFFLLSRALLSVRFNWKIFKSSFFVFPKDYQFCIFKELHISETIGNVKMLHVVQRVNPMDKTVNELARDRQNDWESSESSFWTGFEWNLVRWSLMNVKSSRESWRRHCIRRARHSLRVTQIRRCILVTVKTSDSYVLLVR